MTEGTESESLTNESGRPKNFRTLPIGTYLNTSDVILQYRTHLKRSLMSCHLASQGRLLIKILLSTGFLCNTKQPNEIRDAWCRIRTNGQTVNPGIRSWIQCFWGSRRIYFGPKVSIHSGSVRYIGTVPTGTVPFIGKERTVPCWPFVGTGRPYHWTSVKINIIKIPVPVLWPKDTGTVIPTVKSHLL